MVSRGAFDFCEGTTRARLRRCSTTKSSKPTSSNSGAKLSVLAGWVTADGCGGVQRRNSGCGSLTKETQQGKTPLTSRQATVRQQGASLILLVALGAATGFCGHPPQPPRLWPTRTMLAVPMIRGEFVNGVQLEGLKQNGDDACERSRTETCPNASSRTASRSDSEAASCM